MIVYEKDFEFLVKHSAVPAFGREAGFDRRRRLGQTAGDQGPRPERSTVSKLAADQFGALRMMGQPNSAFLGIGRNSRCRRPHRQKRPSALRRANDHVAGPPTA